MDMKSPHIVDERIRIEINIRISVSR